MLPEIHSLHATHGDGRSEFAARLLKGAAFRLEQIHSFGQSSDPGFWYDQSTPEWVALLRGTATIAFESGDLSLTAGDYLTIPARLRHRVAKTSSDALWLALHFEAESDAPE